MGLIIDTCVLIHAEKKERFIDFEQYDDFGDAYTYISVVTASELLMGVMLANTEARRLKRSAFVEALLLQIPIIDFNLEVARTHAKIYAYLAKKRHMIGTHDLIIAATAISHGHALLTRNKQEFVRVPGLTVLTPF